MEKMRLVLYVLIQTGAILQLLFMLKEATRIENQECQEVEVSKCSWSVCLEGKNLVRTHATIHRRGE